MEATQDYEFDVQRRIDAILERFPDRFSVEQVEQIRARVLRSIELGAALRARELPNGVGPDFHPRAMTRE